MNNNPDTLKRHNRVGANPVLVLAGAAIILAFFVFAFSFWPMSETLRTDSVANKPRAGEAPVSKPTTPQ